MEEEKSRLQAEYSEKETELEVNLIQQLENNSFQNDDLIKKVEKLKSSKKDQEMKLNEITQEKDSEIKSLNKELNAYKSSPTKSEFNK